jgi:ATP-dependent DNA helicase PIF1
MQIKMDVPESVIAPHKKVHEPIEANEDVVASDLNEEQQAAYFALLRGENVFLSGYAGTGKTYVLTKFIDVLHKHGKNVICCAPSGKAAQNLRHGMTVHRAFNIPIGILTTDNDLKTPPKAVRNAEVVIIDEVSMLRIDTFEFICRQLNKAEHMSRIPKQLVVVGDFFQLSPVITKREEAAFQELYPDAPQGFAFQGEMWKACRFHSFNLHEIMRQRDTTFQDNLNKIRVGDLSAFPYFNNMVGSPRDELDKYIHICGTNREADSRNEKALANLPGKTYAIEAEEEGKVGKGDKVAPETLRVKEGARVMFLVNDTEENLYQNGSGGTIEDIDLAGGWIGIETDEGNYVKLQRHSWDVEVPTVTHGTDKEGNPVVRVDTRTIGTYTQFPIKLGYAITIHKSQGQTYDRVIVDPNCFDNGMLYVALSRGSDPEKMFLSYPVPPSALMVSEEVKEFYEGFDEAVAPVIDKSIIKIDCPAYLSDIVSDYISELQHSLEFN